MANDMINFFTDFLGVLASFLMQEPIKYFTAVILGTCVFGLVVRIFKIKS